MEKCPWSVMPSKYETLATSQQRQLNMLEEKFIYNSREKFWHYRPCYSCWFENWILWKGRLSPLESMSTTRVYFKQAKETIGGLAILITEGFPSRNKSRRRWLSYTLSKNSLFFLPCLLFTDAVSMGEFTRPNQGNAFTCSGFCN